MAATENGKLMCERFSSLFDNEERLKTEKQVQGRRRVVESSMLLLPIEGKMSDVLFFLCDLSS